MFWKSKNKKIGIVGYGNMGSAIADGIKKRYSVFVFEKDKTKVKNIPGIIFTETLGEMANQADVLILAVKPQDFSQILNDLKNLVANKLVVSIAAGKPTGYIEGILGDIRVIRVMPNLPAKIGQGMSCLSKGKFASDKDLKLAVKIFNFIGKTLIIDEKMMDSATAVSGSGPGFLFELVIGKNLKESKKFARRFFEPKLFSAATEEGFNPKDARLLSSMTTNGTLAILGVNLKAGFKAEDLRNQVASKGGTTEAGLKVLNSDINNLEAAVSAALKRAAELAK